MGKRSETKAKMTPNLIDSYFCRASGKFMSRRIAVILVPKYTFTWSLMKKGVNFAIFALNDRIAQFKNLFIFIYIVVVLKVVLRLIQTANRRIFLKI